MENVFKTVVAIGGGAASYFFGGWSSLIGILLAFVVIDYISGVVAAAFDGRLSSSVGYKGIAKKVFIFVLVGVANLIDISLGEGHLLRDATIFFYLANELISLVENAGEIGLPVPPALQKIIAVLKDKSDVNINS